MSEPSPIRPSQSDRDHILGLLRELEACLGLERPTCGSSNGSSSSDASSDHAVADAVRREIRRRAERSKFFPAEIFGEPAWNILLDLYLSASFDRPVTVSNACDASSVPHSTAIRWIDMLVDLGMIERQQSELDQRVIFLRLTSTAEKKLISYFAAK